MTDDSPAREPRDNRAPIPVSPTPRQPAWDLTLLVDQRGVEIGFGPRATGSHVITLDEAAATTLFDVLWRCLPPNAHQVTGQQSTTDVTPREMTVTTPAPPVGALMWRTIPSLCCAGLSRSGLIPRAGRCPPSCASKARSSGGTPPGCTCASHHDRAFVVLQAHLVRALNPFESR
ncbi:MAG: hypothetical protein ACRDQ4_20305 [Pseudonocardiaceae bacterium]